MKKIAFFASFIFLLSCGSQKKISSNLTKVSHFSIVTSDRDTLYLKDGDEMTDLLKGFWDKGLFQEANGGKQTFVLVISPDEFNFLSTQCSNESVGKKLTQLGNSY